MFLGAKSLDSFLRKRSWTGEQVGKAFILDACYAYKNKLEGKEGELFTQAQLNKMSSNLSTASDCATYNNYVAVCRWLSSAHLLYLSHYSLYNSAVKALVRIFTEAQAGQRLYEYIDALPLILTEKEYNERKDAYIKNELEHNNLDMLNVIGQIVSCLTEALNKSPRKANILKGIKKKYEQEQVASSIVLANYNRVWGIGYYTINGKKIDDLSEEERQKLAGADIKKLLAEKITLEEAIHGTSPLTDFALKRINEEYEGRKNEGEELLATRKLVVDPNPPTDLTKWDIFEDDTSWCEFWDREQMLSDYEQAGLDTSTVPSQQELYEDFYNEFKDAIALLLEEADKKYKLGLCDIPLKAWADTQISYKKLLDCNFYGFSDLMINDSDIFTERRVAENGIAILRPLEDDTPRFPTRPGTKIDSAGHFIDPIASLPIPFCTGLDQYTDKNPEKEEALQELDQIIEELGNELYFIQGYTKAMEMVMKLTQIRELKVFIPNFELEKARVYAVQNCFRLLYLGIKDTDSPLDEYKQQKLDILDSRLCTIELGDMTINQRNLQWLEEEMPTFKCFKANREVVLELLCNR